MAKLTKKDVLHVAWLAKITLTDSEVDKFTTQLAAVLAYMDELNEVDTSKVEPTSQTTGLENVTRSDLVKADNYLTQDEALSGTDNIYNGYFKVEAILSERTDK